MSIPCRIDVRWFLAALMIGHLGMACPGDDGSTSDQDETPKEEPTPNAGDDDSDLGDDSENQTVGVFVNEPGAYDGYTLFPPLQYTTTYLIDNDGRLVNSWDSGYRPGQAAYLMDDGSLIRTAFVGPEESLRFMAGGAGGRLEKFNWAGDLVWTFEHHSDAYLSHHDIEVLPNGNVLLIAWEWKTRDEALEAGRLEGMLTDDGMWPLHVLEVTPDGAMGADVVWEWHLWDHLVQEEDPGGENYGLVVDHPGRVNINYDSEQRGADWTHTNSIDYHEDLDQILLSIRGFSEIWIIDHSTTVEEAAGHSGGRYGRGGDLLYRWGNPRAYGAGGTSDRQLFVQHDAQWIDSGLPGEDNILIFNNGTGRAEVSYSTVDELEPPLQDDGTYTMGEDGTYGPDSLTWQYVAQEPTDLYSETVSGAQRLPNGNTLICEGAPGRFLEVTDWGEVVWEYISPVINTGPVAQGDIVSGSPSEGASGQMMNTVFKVRRYGPGFAGFDGSDLTPGETVEQ